MLLVGNFLSDVGRGRCVCEDLAIQLSNVGWYVLCTSSKPGRIARLADVVATIWRRRYAYAVAHVDVFSGSAFFLAEAACRMLHAARKPYVLTLRGGNLPVFAGRWPGRVRRLLRSAAVVTAPSRYLPGEMKEYRADIRLVPNPVDVESCRFRLRKRPEPRLVWLRAFHQVYNPSLAPKVLALLAREVSDVRLTMVGIDKGDGSLQAMQQLARRLAVADRITLAGAVPKTEVPHWLSQGDIFLNTTNVDNAPVSVLEAMACGLCVVSTKVGGVAHLLCDGRDALLVPADNADAMAAAIKRILAEPGLAESLSQRARIKSQSCGWSAVLPQWERLFQSLADPAGQHSGLNGEWVVPDDGPIAGNRKCHYVG